MPADGWNAIVGGGWAAVPLLVLAFPSPVLLARFEWPSA